MLEWPSAGFLKPTTWERVPELQILRGRFWHTFQCNQGIPPSCHGRHTRLEDLLAAHRFRERHTQSPSRPQLLPLLPFDQTEPPDRLLVRETPCQWPSKHLLMNRGSLA